MTRVFYPRFPACTPCKYRNDPHFTPCTPCKHRNDPHFAPCMPCKYRNDPHFTPCMPCKYRNDPHFAPCMPCEYRNDPHFAPCMPCEYQNDPHFALCMPCEHSNVIQIAIKRASARGSGDKCRTIRLPPHPPPAADHSSLRDVWRAYSIRPYMYPANFPAPAGAAPTRVQSFIPAGCLEGECNSPLHGYPA